MNILVIEPLVGINELKLGQVITSDTEFLGTADNYIQRGDTWYSKLNWNGQLKIQMDNDNRVTYIGIRNLGTLHYEVVLFDNNVFETPVDKMVEMISQTTRTSFLATDSEMPYSYKLPDLSMTLWREYIPEDTDNLEEKKLYEVFEYIGIGIRE